MIALLLTATLVAQQPIEGEEVSSEFCFVIATHKQEPSKVVNYWKTKTMLYLNQQKPEEDPSILFAYAVGYKTGGLEVSLRTGLFTGEELVAYYRKMCVMEV